jgi:hypothetical protein
LIHERLSRNRLVRISSFRLSFLDVDLPFVDLSDCHILDEILSNLFIFESYKTKTSRLACIDIFKYDCVLYFTEGSLEVIFKLFTSKVEIKTSNKYFRVRISVSNFSIRIVRSS